MGRRGYPPEFRRRALDLLAAGRRATDLARDLGISSQTLYLWRHQEQIDRGLVAGLTSTERVELAAAKRRIRELEAELEIHRRASELLVDRSNPKGASRRSR
jgi:transposase